MYIKFYHASRDVEVGEIGEHGENEWSERYTAEEVAEILTEHSGRKP